MSEAGPFYKKQYGGDDCILCCPTYKCCDCSLIQCVLDFTEFAFNITKDEPYNNIGIMIDEVELATTALIGFTMKATYWQLGIDGEVVNTYGRSYVRSAIEEWGVKPQTFEEEFKEIIRILGKLEAEYAETDCQCSEDSIEACDTLKYIFDTMRSYLRIGMTGNPPYTLEEWERGLCGICYTDCQILDKLEDIELSQIAIDRMSGKTVEVDINEL